MSEFIFSSFPDGEISRTLDRQTLVQRIHRFIAPGDRARVREIGGDWGTWRDERTAVQRILDRVDRMGVGPRLVIQRRSDHDSRAIRELARIPNLGAAPALEEIHAAVWERFNVRSGGLWLCRYIDGTRSVSRHGYLSSSWRGAAEDIFVGSGGMTELVKVARFIAERSKAGSLKAQTVIVDNDIWTRDGWGIYGGQRHYHVHVDVAGGNPCSP